MSQYRIDILKELSDIERRHITDPVAEFENLDIKAMLTAEYGAIEVPESQKLDLILDKIYELDYKMQALEKEKIKGMAELKLLSSLILDQIKQLQGIITETMPLK